MNSSLVKLFMDDEKFNRKYEKYEDIRLSISITSGEGTCTSKQTKKEKYLNFFTIKVKVKDIMDEETLYFETFDHFIYWLKNWEKKMIKYTKSQLQYNWDKNKDFKDEILAAREILKLMYELDYEFKIKGEPQNKRNIKDAYSKLNLQLKRKDKSEWRKFNVLSLKRILKKVQVEIPKNKEIPILTTIYIILYDIAENLDYGNDSAHDYEQYYESYKLIIQSYFGTILKKWNEQNSKGYEEILDEVFDDKENFTIEKFNLLNPEIKYVLDLFNIRKILKEKGIDFEDIKNSSNEMLRTILNMTIISSNELLWTPYFDNSFLDNWSTLFNELNKILKSDEKIDKLPRMNFPTHEIILFHSGLERDCNY